MGAANDKYEACIFLMISKNQDQIHPYKSAQISSACIYDKDTFSTDDFMGEAEIDIQHLVMAARAYERSNINKSMRFVVNGIITLDDGMVKQEINLRLQNVERGVLEIELECVPLTQ
ncbi:hypothetical protein Dsin_000791 [Dipteronia sinensis]|uniref:Uncharacterized protein n=1 Tax=Dipteronia sinensis TaxID=43782 RepID=A0AAE0EJP7_9ROSI|nr:hypothetical protein Dsin_000791 [Dipteronia sinensis]